jgi:membrane fusion protein, multidrug efflux system
VITNEMGPMLSKGNGLDTAQRPVPEGGEPLPEPPWAPRTVAEDELRAPDATQPGEARSPTPHDRQPGGVEPPVDRPDGSRQVGTPNGDEVRKGLLRRHATAIPIGMILLTLAFVVGYVYWDYARHFESTDDAFIASRPFAVAPKVAGYITAVPVTDNQHLAAGNVITRIDERDYRIALAQAEAQVAAAQANIQDIDAQITVQQAQINANQAQVQQAQANLVFAQQQATRYQTLAQRGAGTVENAQQYASQLHQQEAALQTAQATLAVAQRQVGSLNAQRSSAVASLAQAQSQRDQAQLNLSYTTVTAAQPGRVVNLTAAVGQFAQAGTNLTMFVPDEIWVTANFKETQLAAMRPGQPATLRIDAYPGRAIPGHVASIQPGSGTAFSLLPAENATGNYVKIVQRVPVKIIIDDPPGDVALGPGMSVVPSVRVDPAPSLLERLRAHL